jgi:hypothetical protein
VVKVLPTPGAIDELAVLRLVGDVSVQPLERIHDVIEAHRGYYRGAAKVRHGFNGTGVGGPGGEDGSLLLRGHVRIGYDIHGGSEGPGRMKEMVEFKILSVRWFDHGHIPK